MLRMGRIEDGSAGTEAQGGELLRFKHRLYIPDHIDADNLKGLVKTIRTVENEEEGGQVLIEVNTFGGDVGAATELALVMHHSPISVTTLATNKCQSVGILLVAAGNYRFAYPETDFMFHHPTYAKEGKFSLRTWREKVADMERQQSRYLGFIEQFTGIPLERLENEFEKDTHIDSATAVSLGIIDVVVPSVKQRGEIAQ